MNLHPNSCYPGAPHAESSFRKIPTGERPPADRSAFKTNPSPDKHGSCPYDF